MVSLYIPPTDELHDIELSYITYERVVLSEFMWLCREQLISSFGENGVSTVYQRPDHVSLTERYRNPMDPMFFLSSYIEVAQSPLRLVLPYNNHFRGVAKTVKHNRNLWAHYRPPDERHEILLAINNLRIFAAAVGMVDAEAAGVSIGERLREIGASRARAIAGVASSDPTVATVYVPVNNNSSNETVVEEPTPVRPRIGGSWVGDLPGTVLELSNKYQDVLDASGHSMKTQLGAGAAKSIKRWLSMNIKSWLFVDPRDGATVALMNGDPHLIGYLGDEPELQPADYRGFFLTGIYENREGMLSEIENGNRFETKLFDTSPLTKDWVNANITSDASVRFTDYGDVVLIDDDGSRRILTLEEK
jgi:hypothetical protein